MKRLLLVLVLVGIALGESIAQTQENTKVTETDFRGVFQMISQTAQGDLDGDTDTDYLIGGVFTGEANFGGTNLGDPIDYTVSDFAAIVVNPTFDGRLVFWDADGYRWECEASVSPAGGENLRFQALNINGHGNPPATGVGALTMEYPCGECWLNLWVPQEGTGISAQLQATMETHQTKTIVACIESGIAPGGGFSWDAGTCELTHTNSDGVTTQVVDLSGLIAPVAHANFTGFGVGYTTANFTTTSGFSTYLWNGQFNGSGATAAGASQAYSVPITSAWKTLVVTILATDAKGNSATDTYYLEAPDMHGETLRVTIGGNDTLAATGSFVEPGGRRMWDHHLPFRNIQTAINAAQAGESVSIEAGSYTETITLKDQVDLNFDSGVDIVGLIQTPGGGATCKITGRPNITRTAASFVFAFHSANYTDAVVAELGNLTGLGARCGTIWVSGGSKVDAQNLVSNTMGIFISGNDKDPSVRCLSNTVFGNQGVPNVFAVGLSGEGSALGASPTETMNNRTGYYDCEGDTEVVSATSTVAATAAGVIVATDSAGTDLSGSWYVSGKRFIQKTGFGNIVYCQVRADGHRRIYLTADECTYTGPENTLGGNSNGNAIYSLIQDAGTFSKSEVYYDVDRSFINGPLVYLHDSTDAGVAQDGVEGGVSATIKGGRHTSTINVANSGMMFTLRTAASDTRTRVFLEGGSYRELGTTLAFAAKAGANPATGVGFELFYLNDVNTNVITELGAGAAQIVRVTGNFNTSLLLK